MPIRFKLSEVVEASGISIRRLAKDSDVDYKTLHSLKTGKQKGLSFAVLDRICRALKCEPGALLEIVEDKQGRSIRGGKARDGGKPKGRRTIR
jgi:putative transcriptional regulator